MKLKMAALLLCAALLVPASTAFAQNYDRDDSDNPLRYGAYLLHPVGVLLEYTVTRPVYWFVHLPGLNYVFGAERAPKAKVVEDVAVIERPAADMKTPVAPGLTENQTALRGLMNGQLEIDVAPDSVRYTMVGDVYFKPGSADLTDEGKNNLTQIIASIKMDYPGKEVMIEGHTDDQPIARSGWKSNWELGSARALAILHFMARMNFDPSKLSAATYGQYRELAANDSPAQRALNRRAVITVKTESAPAPAPAPVAPAPGAAIVAPIDMSDPAP